MKQKINTRLTCAILTASCGTLGIGLPKLDPNNFWLSFWALIFLAVAAGAGAVITFYEKLFKTND